MLDPNTIPRDTLNGMDSFDTAESENFGKSASHRPNPGSSSRPANSAWLNSTGVSVIDRPRRSIHRRSHYMPRRRLRLSERLLKEIGSR
jgi:hypothetical protein